MFREFLLAITFIGFSSLTFAEDYELRTPTESIKAKSRDSCEAGRRAIARGWIKSIPKLTKTECLPRPGFFTKEENCIKGFNC